MFLNNPSFANIDRPASFWLYTGCPDQIGRNLKITLLHNQKTCRQCKGSFGIVRNTPSVYKSVTLGRITKTKLSKYVGLSQIKWDLKKKCVHKGP